VTRHVRGLGGHSRVRRFPADPVVVDLAVRGWPMRLTVPERHAVIQQLTAKGLSANEIAARLGVAQRTVTRYRAKAS
jgi:DNA-binding NarL/FixJ family response regulator